MKSLAEKMATRARRKSATSKKRKKPAAKRAPRKLAPKSAPAPTSPPAKRSSGTAYEQAKALYGSPLYKAWRDFVFKRDAFTCQMCGAKDCSLEGHHIKPKYLYPELTLERDNGITLCKGCHQKIVCKREMSFVHIFTRIAKLNMAKWRRTHRS